MNFNSTMETQVALAIPGEAGSLHVHSSSQGTCSVRGALTRCLGLPASKIIVETKRAGTICSLFFSSLLHPTPTFG
jgi:xanthine dehydrogenase molybdopterin-binding subunit B